MSILDVELLKERLTEDDKQLLFGLAGEENIGIGMKIAENMGAMVRSLVTAIIESDAYSGFSPRTIEIAVLYQIQQSLEMLSEGHDIADSIDERKRNRD